MTTPRPFDETDPLPQPGRTVLLEASAGTGKTYTIASLAVRFIAEEGVSAKDLLIVTFSRSATAELRDRIRERIASTVRIIAGADQPVGDRVAELLAAKPAALRDLAEQRLRAALADFDAATISTVHQFCSQTLRGLGVLGDADAGEELLERLDGLTDRAATDVFLQMLAEEGFAVGAGSALTTAGKAIADGQSSLAQELLPVPADDPGRTQEFARRARARAAVIRRAAGWVTYDDQITRLRDVIRPRPGGSAHLAELARANLRAEFPVVLVDEFQDTDEAQWAVLHSVFHGHSRLMLIGDPKQAIYAFRGGDVHTYAHAAEQAHDERTLLHNYRSDPAVIDGINLLFADRQLGQDPPITARRVEAALAGSRLRSASGEPVPAFRGRWLAGSAPVGDLRNSVAADTAEQIALALASGMQIRDKRDWRAVTAADFAVLCPTHKEIRAVTAALAARGIPSRGHSGDRVLHSTAALDWLTLLHAITDPTWTRLGNSAAVQLLGADPRLLATDPDEFADRYGGRLRELAAIAEPGFPALAAAVLGDPAAMAVIGSRPQPARYLSDLRQVAELLSRHDRRNRPSTTGLRDWLADQIADPTDDQARLESREPAVAVTTIHSAKGLQWPIVHVPFAWDSGWRNYRDGSRLHVAQPEGPVRALDLRDKCAGREESRRRARAEEDEEALRLLYVALTRAASQVTWTWAQHNGPGGKNQTADSPLHRLLCAAAGGDTVPAARYEPEPSRWLPWAERQEELDLAEIPSPAGATTVGPPHAAGDFRAAAFTREVDHYWRRTSYSALTAAAHEAPTGSGLTDDEPPGADPEPGGTPPDAVVSPWDDLPGGTSFGSMVHHILEVTPGDADMTVLAANTAAAIQRFGLTDVPVEQLLGALEPARRTPLGPLADGADLFSFGAGQRLAELDFEISLDTAAAVGGSSRLRDLAELMSDELPSDDPLADYPRRLAALPGPAVLRGFLSGSIDAVLRQGTGAGQRFIVVDYKTNRLGPARGSGRPLTTWDYRNDALPEAMMAAHYPLQALLYCVALHRYLRYRMGVAYQPEQHLGGVLYLFLRGMAGPSTPTTGGIPDGVFTWQPSAQLVTTASDLLSGGLVGGRR